ncbi:MAG: hypothetical protein M1831_003636 [Alyxoria varia]|nr:MAG: hypothetical protein M1831_003636 [Alyxoria varia]
MSKSVVRSVKNVTKGYSSVQVKVRNATSNDAWGPSGTDMSEIAQMTYNNSSDFYEIMDMLDKRMNDKGKNWRHVLKSLKVLDYCLHEGSELAVTWARKNMYIIKTLREFQYIDEDGRDVGQNVRVSAKELTSLILDEERLRAERHDRKLWKSRVTGLDDNGGASGFGVDPPRRRQDRQRGENEEDDLEYRLAIEASKTEAEEEKKRREQGSAAEVVPDDDDLAKAIKLSKEEEELRRKELENNNAASLFDDAPTQPSQPQATGWNQGYQQQGAVDWFGNPVDQQQQHHQQPQSTGFLNNMYSQPQQTGFQNGYGYNPYQQPMQPGFDQSQMQNQSQFQPAQQSFIQPQQTALGGNNPYAQQANGFGLQNQQQQPLQHQEAAPQPGSQNPWASNSFNQDSVRPQPTGSNNPFASSLNKPQPTSAQRQPSLQTLAEQKTQTPFSPLNSQMNQQQTPFSQPQSQPQLQQQQQPQQQAQLQQQSTQSQNPHHAQLNALLASGEGQDTFGNTGDLRLPAQHTAPGTFVNSAGSGLTRLPANQTGAGNNPFFQNQPTGMPQQQQRMAPAQTGPVNGFGGGGFGGSANPFASQQRPAQQQQGGSLIDL